MNRTVRAGLAVLVLGALVVGSVFAADSGRSGRTGTKAGVAAKADDHKSAGKKDPIVDAFALPRGATLRPDQQTAFTTMRGQFEPQLRAALDEVQQATNQQDKTTAAKKVSKIRGDIKKEIHRILAMPSPNVSKDTSKKKVDHPKQPRIFKPHKRG